MNCYVQVDGRKDVYTGANQYAPAGSSKLGHNENIFIGGTRNPNESNTSTTQKMHCNCYYVFLSFVNVNHLYAYCFCRVIKYIIIIW